MEVVFTEWLSAGLRWLHVVAGIAWIGSSFYFIALDLSLRERRGLPEGASGEAWQVHGGGFYQIAKYLVAPARLPDHLTWFKWEAYTTWLSGFALMVVVYYLNAEFYLLDTDKNEWSAGLAIGVSLAGLVAGWLGYEALCRSPLRNSTTLIAVIGYLALVAATYGFMQVFNGRGAFIQMGALIGTMMVFNVFIVIIPNQKKIVASLLKGEKPDPALGAESKLRSVHNNYLTLPVIFLMLGNHYPLFYATEFNWLIVAMVLALGPVIRHFFNTRHAGKGSPWWVWGVAAAGMLAVFYLSSLGPPRSSEEMTQSETITEVAFADVEEIVLTRCSMCHASEVLWDGIAIAPKGVLLDTPAEIERHLRQMEITAVRSNAMPPGNITYMESAERALLAAWIAAGAPLDDAQN